MLNETITYETKLSDLFFKNLEEEILLTGKYVADLTNDKEHFNYKWDSRKYKLEGRGALVKIKNSNTDDSQIWVNNKIQINTEIKELIALTEHLTRVYSDVKKINTNIEWIYVTFDIGLVRTYPWFDTKIYPSGNFDLREREYYKLAKFNSDKSIVWSKPYIDALGKGWMVTGSLPLYDKKDKFIGVQSIDVTIKSLIHNILDFKVGKTGYAFMVDRSGNIIALSEAAIKDLKLNDIEGKNSINILETPDDNIKKVFKNSLLNYNKNIQIITLNGIEKYFVSSHIPTTKWIIGVIIPRKEIIEAALKMSKELGSYVTETYYVMEKSTSNGINRVIIGIFITALLAIIISIIISNRLIKPIKELTDGTKIIAGGNLDYTIKTTSVNEVGQLAISFNIMAEKLNNLYEKLEKEIKNVKETNLKLDLLQKLSKTISREFNMEEILNKIINGCTNILGAEMGYFIIIENKYYKAVAAAGEARLFIGKKQLRDTHPIVEDTLNTKDCIFIPDIRTIPKYNLGHTKILNIKEIISAPIYVDNEPVGIMQIFNSYKAKKHLKEEDVEILKLFIPHAEIAIKNSRIYNQLEENRKYISNLIKNIPNPLIVLDKNKRIVDINDISKNIFDNKKDNILHKNIFEVFDKKYAEIIKNAIWQASIFGFASCDVNIKKNDTEMPIILNISTIKNANGELINILMVITDITELKNREKELFKLNQELDRAIKAKTLFLAKMSHELRTPLNAIIGFSEVLINKIVGDLNTKQIECLTDIYNGGKHLLAIINDLLDLTKLEANKLELNFEKVETKILINNSLVAIKDLAKKKKIEIEINCDENLAPIEVDLRRFNQILYNILSNAVKFTPEGGKVAIIVDRVDFEEVKKHKDKIGFIEFPRVLTKHKMFLKVSVIDTGIGIAEKDMNKIFKEFEQIDSGLSRTYEGTGLGLAVTKELVELHGGTIVAESIENKGSTFTFFIPYRNS
jgi:PAS domain S-box-containing protein